MALWKCLLGCLFLASALNNGDAQPLPESVYEQLTAQQLRELELGQNPELLELAARTGERIVVDMANAEQGAAVQTGVNAVLDCTSWLQNFPGGTVTWYRFRYLDLEFTMLGPKELQDRRVLDADVAGLRKIEGDYNEIYNITRVRIQAGEEDPHAGQYRCEVCVGGPPGSPFRECHNATTSLLTIGRPPILNDATGRTPDMKEEGEYSYRIGSTICVEIHPTNFTFNSPPNSVLLSCPSVGEYRRNNIPPAIPRPTRTWTHTDLMGREEILSSVLAGESVDPTDDFLDTFDKLTGDPFIILNRRPVDSLRFRTFNVTKNASTERYQTLMQAFGLWTCKLNNSLGEEEATTVLTDDCGALVPSIQRLPCDLEIVERGQTEPINIGCDVCIQQADELWLTIICPVITPTDTFLTERLNFSATIRWEDGDGNELQGVGNTLFVQKPGTYRCIADIGNGQDEDFAETTISFIPEVTLEYTRDGHPTSGCDRLRTDQEFSPRDVCAYVGEVIALNCTSPQENVDATPIFINGEPAPDSFPAGIDTEGFYQCMVSSTDPDINIDCPVDAAELNLTVYNPAQIVLDSAEVCTSSAGAEYRTVRAPIPGGVARLCCVAVGNPPPDVTWTRIRVDSSGIARELPVDETDPDITREDDTLIIANYNITRDGTYVCRARNIAGVDSGYIALTSRIPQPIDLQGNATNTSVTLQWRLPGNVQQDDLYFNVSYSGVVDWRSNKDVYISFKEQGQTTADNTSLVIYPLTPSTEYVFKVAAVTSEGQGEEAVVVVTTNKEVGDKLAYFQIRILDINDCEEWHSEGTKQKLADIRKSLVSILNAQCTCDITTSHISQGEFSCRSDPNDSIVYRARISGTPTVSASDLATQIRNWVQGGSASIMVGSLRLHLDSNCDATLDNIHALDCNQNVVEVTDEEPTDEEPTDEEPTDDKADETDSSKDENETDSSKDEEDENSKSDLRADENNDSSTSSGEVVGIVVGGIIAGLLLALLIALIVIIIVWLKKLNSKSSKAQSVFTELVNDPSGHGSAMTTEDDKTEKL